LKRAGKGILYTLSIMLLVKAAANASVYCYRKVHRQKQPVLTAYKPILGSLHYTSTVHYVSYDGIEQFWRQVE
jgi:hypothetical protein